MAATANLNIRIGSDSRRFKRGMADVKRIIGTVIASLAGLQFGRIAVQGALEFEKRLLEIDTIARQGKAGIGVFKKGILELGQEIGATTEELTGGLYDALSAGVPNEKALSFLKVAAKAALAGVTDTKTAVSGLVSIMNAYSLEASEVDRVSDGFFTTIRLGKTTFPELSEGIGKTASIAAQAGVSFEELMSSVATLTKAGINTDVAVTSLSSSIVGLIKPATVTEDLLAKMGFQTGRAAIAALGLQGTLQGLAAAAKKEGIETAKVFANKRALNTLFNVTGERAEGAKKDLIAFSEELGSSASAFKVFEGSATQSMNRAKAVVEAFTLSMGELAFPALQKEENLRLLKETLEGMGIAIRAAVDHAGDLFAFFDKINEKIAEIKGASIREGIIGGSLTDEEIAEAREVRKAGGSVADTKVGRELRAREIMEGFKDQNAAEVAKGLAEVKRLRDPGNTKKLFFGPQTPPATVPGSGGNGGTTKTDELLHRGVTILETIVAEQ